MPLYDYQCVDCGAQDLRLAGIDDHTALCVECGGLMLRLDVDIFKAEPPAKEAKP
jgi:putative FmdB family regulatory protein